MKLSLLFRSPLLASHQNLRRWKPRVSEETLFERKQAKRLKNTNTLDNEFTNEKVVELMIPKRVKAIGLYLEKHSNTHPELAPIDPKVKEQIKTKFAKDAEYQYYRWRNQEYQLEGFLKAGVDSNIDQETQTLPRNIQKEMKEVQRYPTSITNTLADECLYLQQYQLFLPAEEYNKKMVLERMGRTLEGFVPSD